MNEEQNYGDNWMTQFWVLQLPNSSQTGQTVLDYLCVKPYDESIFSDLYDSPVHMSYLDPPCYFTAIAMYIKKRISFLQYLLCYGAGCKKLADQDPSHTWLFLGKNCKIDAIPYMEFRYVV